MKKMKFIIWMVLISSFGFVIKRDDIAIKDSKTVVITFREGNKIIKKGKPKLTFKSHTKSFSPVFINDSTFRIEEIKDSVDFIFNYNSFNGNTGMISPEELKNFDRIDIHVIYCGPNCSSNYAVIFSPDGPWIEFYSRYRK